jgi:hypothetical protein
MMAEEQMLGKSPCEVCLRLSYERRSIVGA